MGRQKKFTEAQKLMVVNLYSVKKYTINEIVKEFKNEITKSTIYTILKEFSIPLERKKGKKHDIVGKQFGKLIVIKLAQTNKSGKAKEWRAICECECGNKNVDVHPQALIRNYTTSCGCRKDQYLKNTGKNNKQFTGYEGINGKYWGLIKKRAEKRGYKINIDVKFAWELYIKQEKKCALTKLPIEFAISNKNYSETTASLDRIDSTKGYTSDNVQWVDKKINIMKNIFSQEKFIYLCKLVAENN